MRIGIREIVAEGRAGGKGPFTGRGFIARRLQEWAGVGGREATDGRVDVLIILITINRH